MTALRVIDVPQERPSLALELPESTSFDEWVSIGRRLCLVGQALNWQIGDWWAFGDHRYGERAQAAAEGIFGREFQTLANLASVARRVEPYRRREVVSWTHHAEVAALEPDEADALLDRAAREHLSTRDLRREVQALKVSNDTDGEVRSPPASKPIPPQTARADMTAAYEAVIELAEALQLMRKLSKREARLLSIARDFVHEARAGHRECPSDFDIIFVEKGRVECELWYRASRLTVNRWLVERGKSRLIELRAAFIQHLRSGRRPVEEPAAIPVAAEPVDQAMYALAKPAADFLRVSRYGGWRITDQQDGTWLVGTVRKTSDELVAMAERQGFDVAAIERSYDPAVVNG